MYSPPFMHLVTCFQRLNTPHCMSSCHILAPKRIPGNMFPVTPCTLMHVIVSCHVLSTLYTSGNMFPLTTQKSISYCHVLKPRSMEIQTPNPSPTPFGFSLGTAFTWAEHPCIRNPWIFRPLCIYSKLHANHNNMFEDDTFSQSNDRPPTAYISFYYRVIQIITLATSVVIRVSRIFDALVLFRYAITRLLSDGCFQAYCPAVIVRAPS